MYYSIFFLYFKKWFSIRAVKKCNASALEDCEEAVTAIRLDTCRYGA